MDREVVFPSNWTPPRELTRALPRETRLSGRGLFNVILSAVFMLAALFLALWVRNHTAVERAQTQQLRSQGQEATAEIAKLWQEKSTHMVSYAFTANGVRLKGEAAVPDKLWPGVQKAGFLPVLFLPSDPAVNHPKAWDLERLPDWFPIAIPAMWAVGSGILLFNLLRQGKVAAEGVPTAGVITRCSRIKGGWAARYQFRTPDGIIAKGRDRIYTRLEPGAAVCVLYLPDNPRRNYIYPLCLHMVTK